MKLVVFISTPLARWNIYNEWPHQHCVMTTQRQSCLIVLSSAIEGEYIIIKSMECYLLYLHMSGYLRKCVVLGPWTSDVSAILLLSPTTERDALVARIAVSYFTVWADVIILYRRVSTLVHSSVYPRSDSIQCAACLPHCEYIENVYHQPMEYWRRVFTVCDSHHNPWFICTRGYCSVI